MTTDLTAILTAATAQYERVVEMHQTANRLAISMLEAGINPATADEVSKRLDKERDVALQQVIDATTAIREEEAAEDVPTANLHCTYECGGCVNGEICDDVIEYTRTGNEMVLLAPTVATCKHRAPTEECAMMAGA